MIAKCFEFRDYKTFIREWIAAQPRRGRGLSRQLAEHLRIHSTMMSHILGGKQHFSEDQALGVAEFMGLSELETEYFLELVRLDRAATPKLRERIQKRLASLRESAQEIKNRIEAHHRLTPEDSARFYSNWFYSALRLLTDIPRYQERSELLNALGLPREAATQAIQFLLEKGLIRESEGRLVLGPSRTHLPADSPYIWTMHKNWRLKAIERHGKMNDTELFYSAPMSISESDVKKVREVLVQAIAEVTKIAAQSRAEKLVALNLDWFQVV